MDNKEIEQEINAQKEEVHSLAMDLLKDYRLREKRSFIERIVILILWTISLVFTIGIFIWYLNQYDFSTTIESTGVYSIVDGNGNIISSDIPPEKIETIMELISNGKDKSNQNP